MAGQTDSPVSGKADLSQLCLGYPDGIALTEFALCPASKLNSRLHRPPLYRAVSMVCVTGLFTQSVASTYNGLGAIDLYALDPDWGLGILTFIGLFFMEGRQSSVTRIGRPFGTVLALAITRACPVLCALFSLPPFTIEGLGSLLLMIRFIPRFGWGHGIFNSIFVAVSAFVMRALIIFGR